MSRLSTGFVFLCLGALPVLAQTTLIGTYSGGGPAGCDDGGAGQQNFSGSLSATVQPTLSSLASSGGQFSGTVSGQGSISGSPSSCFPTLSQTVSGTISGTVSPGGAVAWSFQVDVMNSDGGSSTPSASGGTGTASML